MFLSTRHIDAISQMLQDRGITQPVAVERPVSGGSINSCYLLRVDRPYFLKINHASKFPGMFSAEAKGLELIRRTETIRVPEVITHGNSGSEQFLLMEWIDSGRSSAQSQSELGRKLAEMHRQTNSEFGLDHDNYMGSLAQSNKFHSSWTDFFISERLEPQIKLAVLQGSISSSMNMDFQSLFSRLGDLYPDENPALTHGDLWSGNYMISASGEPVLIDPAAAYAHREIDIAMSTLFGGFSSEFYGAYQEEFPLERGWQQRVDLWNLYPLLIHLNLFGTGYLQQVTGCLKRFI